MTTILSLTDLDGSLAQNANTKKIGVQTDSTTIHTDSTGKVALKPAPIDIVNALTTIHNPLDPVEKQRPYISTTSGYDAALNLVYDTDFTREFYIPVAGSVFDHIYGLVEIDLSTIVNSAGLPFDYILNNKGLTLTLYIDNTGATIGCVPVAFIAGASSNKWVTPQPSSPTESNPRRTIDKYTITWTPTNQIVFIDRESSDGGFVFSTGDTGLINISAINEKVILGGELRMTNGGTGTNLIAPGLVYSNGNVLFNATSTNIVDAIGQAPVNFASVAANLAGGDFLQIPYQTTGSLIGYISAPSNDTYLNFNGSEFNWKTITKSFTINGTTISLGDSVTITAADPNPITIGTGLLETSYSGSTARTIGLSNTGVTAGTYGSASAIPVITVNSQGQLTSVATITPALTASQINAALTSSDLSVNGITVGKGKSSIASNTAVGVTVLGSNTTGAYNTATGSGAMASNTTGSYNGAFGYGALFKNLTGVSNTAVGNVALYNNTSGAYNTSVGGGSLANNTVGNWNTALGLEALNGNTSGILNAAIGTNSLYKNTTGSYNVGIGSGSLYNNTVGSYNVAQGIDALSANTSSYNVAIGYAANKNGTGSSNTAIGYQAMYPSNSCTNVFALGYNSGNDALKTVTTDANIGILGNNSITAIYSKVALTVVSDERDKGIISRDIPLGLDYINQVANTALITYQFKTSREDDTPNGRIRYGISAQNALDPDSVIIDSTDPDKLRYNESDLIAVLIKAVAELSAKVDKLEQK